MPGMLASLSNCKRCDGPISLPRRRRGAHYCTERCQEDAAKEKYRGLFPDHGIAPSTVGTISELVVATDLLRRGYEVFRAMSASCSCDLAVIANGKLVRIEVRTGRMWNGKLTYAFKESDKARHDVLAVAVQGEWAVTYFPPFDEGIRL